jgi:hypothetical protein
LIFSHFRAWTLLGGVNWTIEARRTELLKSLFTFSIFARKERAASGLLFGVEWKWEGNMSGIIVVGGLLLILLLIVGLVSGAPNEDDLYAPPFGGHAATYDDEEIKQEPKTKRAA